MCSRAAATHHVIGEGNSLLLRRPCAVVAQVGPFVTALDPAPLPRRFLRPAVRMRARAGVSGGSVSRARVNEVNGLMSDPRDLSGLPAWLLGIILP